MSTKMSRIVFLLIVLIFAIFAMYTNAQEDTPDQETDPETDPETEVPDNSASDIIRYVPPNFLFLSVVIMTPEHGLSPTSGFYQRVQNWAHGCLATDVQPRLTAFLGNDESRLTVDVISTTDLIGGCSLTALQLAIKTYIHAEVVSFKRSTTSDIQTGCITQTNGLWMPTCSDDCASWQCAYQLNVSNASFASYAFAAVVAIVGAVVIV